MVPMDRQRGSGLLLHRSRPVRPSHAADASKKVIMDGTRGSWRDDKKEGCSQQANAIDFADVRYWSKYK